MFDCKNCGIEKSPDQFRTHKRGYRIGTCKECERAYQRAVCSKNPEKYRARKRESMAKRRRENPEAVRSYQNQQYHQCREANLAKMKAYQYRRFFWLRATKLPDVTAQDLASMWKKQRGRCALTGCKMDRTAQIDHITPRARGGGDEITNLRWTTKQANAAKRDMTDAEFLALCADVVATIGERIKIVEEMHR